jgi:hypothetical protein
MSAKVFMYEASKLAAEVPRNRCPATDSLEWLDSNPAARLAWALMGNSNADASMSDRVARQLTVRFF